MFQAALPEGHDLFRKYAPVLVSGDLPTPTVQTGGCYYRREPIDDVIILDDEVARRIRALYCPPYGPRLLVGGREWRLEPL
jgi:hypothetical protein